MICVYHKHRQSCLKNKTITNKAFMLPLKTDLLCIKGLFFASWPNNTIHSSLHIHMHTHTHDYQAFCNTLTNPHITQPEIKLYMKFTNSLKPRKHITLYAVTKDNNKPCRTTFLACTLYRWKVKSQNEHPSSKKKKCILYFPTRLNL